jgi:hypothetical protein
MTGRRGPEGGWVLPIGEATTFTIWAQLQIKQTIPNQTFRRKKSEAELCCLFRLENPDLENPGNSCLWALVAASVGRGGGAGGRGGSTDVD